MSDLTYVIDPGAASTPPRPLPAALAALPTEPARRPERGTALIILAGLAVAYTLYVARPLLFPIFFAVILSFLLRPVVRRLARWRIPTPLAAALVLASFLCVIGLVGARIIEPAATWIQQAPDDLEQVGRRLRSLREPFKEFTKASEKVEEIAQVTGTSSQALAVEVKESTFAATLLNTTGGVLAGAFLTAVLLYFLLAAGDRFLDHLVDLMPTWRDKRSLRQLFTEIEEGISTYLTTITVINTGLGVAVGFAMWLMGMPNPVLWGVMAACLNFIPYVGAIFGVGVVFLVAVLSFDTLGQAFAVPAVYFGLTAVEGNFVTPSILGRRMSLSPIMILLSLIFWGWLWGPAGALLAVSLLAIAKIVCDHFERTAPLGRLLGK